MVVPRPPPGQVHIRVASPPIRFPCYMGINIPTKEELIANKPEFQDLAKYIGESALSHRKTPRRGYCPAASQSAAPTPPPSLRLVQVQPACST